YARCAQVTRAAEELDRVKAVGQGGFGDGDLRHRDLGAGFTALVYEPAGPVEHQPGAGQALRHDRDAVRDRLEVRDFPAKLPPPARMVDLHLQLALHQAEIDGEQAATLPVHRSLEDQAALALAAESARDRHPAPRERDPPGQAAVQTHLFQGRAHFDARKLTGHDEAGGAKETGTAI